MTDLSSSRKLMVALIVALSFVTLPLAAPGASGADRLKVDFTKHWTGHPRGLQYQYTFKVISAASGAPINGAEFTVVGDMPAMRGHHPTRPAVVEPGNEAGTYKATLHFFMEGEWELKLVFNKPRRDGLLLLDTVQVAKKVD